MFHFTHVTAVCWAVFANYLFGHVQQDYQAKSENQISQCSTAKSKGNVVSAKLHHRSQFDSLQGTLDTNFLGWEKKKKCKMSFSDIITIAALFLHVWWAFFVEFDMNIFLPPQIHFSLLVCTEGMTCRTVDALARPMKRHAMYEFNIL